MLSTFASCVHCFDGDAKATVDIHAQEVHLVSLVLANQQLFPNANA
jgi:hypothetical protein